MSDSFQKMIETEIERRVAERLKAAAPAEDPRLDQVRDILQAYTDAAHEALERLMTDLAAVLNPAGGKRKTRVADGGPVSTGAGKPTDTDTAIVAALETGSKTFGELMEAAYPNKPARGGVQIGTKNALARLTAAGKVTEIADGTFALVAEGGEGGGSTEGEATGAEESGDEEMPTLQIPEDEGEEVELEAN